MELLKQLSDSLIKLKIFVCFLYAVLTPKNIL